MPKKKHSCPKRKIRKILFQKEGEGWKSAWVANLALIKWLNQTAYYDQTCLCPTIGKSMYFDRRVPNHANPNGSGGICGPMAFLTAETENICLCKLYSSPNLWKIIKVSRNLYKCST